MVGAGVGDKAQELCPLLRIHPMWRDRLSSPRAPEAPCGPC